MMKMGRLWAWDLNCDVYIGQRSVYVYWQEAAERVYINIYRKYVLNYDEYEYRYNMHMNAVRWKIWIYMHDDEKQQYACMFMV